MSYGRGTGVSSSRSKAQIEELLWKHGAEAVMTMASRTKADVAFRLGGYNVRLSVPLPNPEDFRFTETGRERSDAQTHKFWEQGCRERWRSVWLLARHARRRGSRQPDLRRDAGRRPARRSAGRRKTASAATAGE